MGLDFDVSFVIALHVLFGSLTEKGDFEDKIDVINLKYFQNNSPETYQKILEIMEEDKKLKRQKMN